MSFRSDWAFFLLIPLFVLGAYLIWRRSQRTPSLQFSQIQVFKKITASYRAKLWWLPEALKFLALVFVIVALARPQSSDTHTKRNVEGIDIMIALDISDSMLIEDMKPFNRLEAAKDTIKNFVKSRNSDRIGIVIFAGESFTLVPLTLDYELILSRVDEIKTAQEAHIKDGTAIGVAMANAAGKLKDSTAKNRVIIFATDGENNSGLIDPETGLEIARGYGIKVYSIGMGRSGPTKIPTYQRDVFGNRVKVYQPFESTVNDDLLGRMASLTGGKYYRASKEDSLGPIFKDIDRLEKTKIDVNKFTRYTELYRKYLMIGFWLYSLSLILSATLFRRAV
jgi:Ca-activated chloride channel family protein